MFMSELKNQNKGEDLSSLSDLNKQQEKTYHCTIENLGDAIGGLWTDGQITCTKCVCKPNLEKEGLEMDKFRTLHISIIVVNIYII